MYWLAQPTVLAADEQTEMDGQTDQGGKLGQSKHGIPSIERENKQNIMQIDLFITPFGAIPVMGWIHALMHGEKGPNPKLFFLQK